MKNKQEQMLTASSSELHRNLDTTRDYLEELTVNYMNLRSGGCAMEALLDKAKAEVEAIETELVRRGEL